MGSLKDALQKAGFHSSKRENERRKVRQKDKKKIEIHQEERNFCDHCETIQPDVEFYKHRNPTVDAQWLCARCADLNCIPDDSRQTQQSNFSKMRRFRREFGSMKKFETNERFSKGRSDDRRGPNRNRDNRDNQRNRNFKRR